MCGKPNWTKRERNLSSVQIGTCFAFFDRLPSLKQRSDWHGQKTVEKRKASVNLNADLSSENGRKTVEKRKASANLNAALAGLWRDGKSTEKPLTVVKMPFVQIMFSSLFVIPIQLYPNQKPEVGRRQFSVARSEF